MSDFQQVARSRLVWGAKASDNISTHALWGVSPARDLLEPKPSSLKEPSEKEPIRILLMSPGDMRDLLVTLRDRCFDNDKMRRPIHFYVHESSAEVMARHLVLLSVALDFGLPLRDRSSIWLEILGNLRIQEKTAQYMETIGKELADIATATNADEDIESVLGTILDLSKLRFRDRDNLIDACQALKTETKIPDLDDLWNRRLRTHLGNRYESRNGAFDWDYRSDFEKHGAGIIHVKQYKQWRDNGIAFEFADQHYTQANRSLITYAPGILHAGKYRGQKRLVKGFWGDTLTGPYLGFGTHLIDPDLENSLLHIVDKGTGSERYRHNATVLAVYNLLSCFWTFETGQRYKLTQPDDIYSGLGDDELAASRKANPKKAAEHARQQALSRADSIVETFGGVRFIALGGDPSSSVFSKFHHFFDVIFLGLNVSQHLPQVASLLKPNGDACLHVEAAKFVLPLTHEQRQLYAQKVHAMAVAAKLKPLYATQPALKYDDPAIKNLLDNCTTAPADLNLRSLPFITTALTPAQKNDILPQDSGS